MSIGLVNGCGSTLSINQSLCCVAVHSPYYEAQGDCDLWAFERIPRRIFQWSWTSCGLVSHEQMARTCACDIELLKRELEEAPKDWETILELQEAPKPQPSAAPPPADPLPGELVHIWQIRATPDGNNDTWNSIPTYMWHSIDREVNLYKFMQASEATSRKRRYAKDPLSAISPIYIHFYASTLTVLQTATVNEGQSPHAYLHIYRCMHRYLYICIVCHVLDRSMCALMLCAAHTGHGRPNAPTAFPSGTAA